MSAEVDLTDIRVLELPTIDLSGGVDLGLDLDNIRIRELAPISFGLTNLPPVNLNASLAIDSLPTLDITTSSTLSTDNNLTSNSTLNTDNKVDLALDVRVRELPQLDVQFGLRPMRFHFPVNYRCCLTLFGIRIFEFRTCGESMVIAEDYTATKSESCE